MTISMQPASKTLRVNDLALHYLEWGEADAPDIVCVHGYTGSADAFNALARRLKDRFHILAPDVRGHGESAWSPTGAYQYADQAGDLAAVCRPAGARPICPDRHLDGRHSSRWLMPRHTLSGFGAGNQRHRSGGRGRHPAHHADGRQQAGRVRDPGRGDGVPPRACLADLAGAAPTTSANSRSACCDSGRTASGGWKMDPAYIRQRVEHGAPVRPAGVAGAAGPFLPDSGGMGHRERCPLRGPSAAHGRHIAARRTGQGAGDRARADIGRTPIPRRARTLPRRLVTAGRPFSHN